MQTFKSTNEIGNINDDAEVGVLAQVLIASTPIGLNSSLIFQ